MIYVFSPLTYKRQEQQQQQPNKVSPWAPIHDPARAELWDEFPNGRYGDSRSPAYGQNTFSAGQILPVKYFYYNEFCT